MLYGIGCDLCGVQRMEELLTGPHAAAFVRRVFGPAERELLELEDLLPKAGSARRAGRIAARAAANFAAKEAFLKAAGTGLVAPFSLREIEAVRLPSGAPEYRFSGRTADWVAERGLFARLSLSHDAGMALAFCTLEQPAP